MAAHNTDYANPKLATHLLNSQAGNVLYSPISIHSLFSMLSQGMQGTTSENFDSVFKITNATIQEYNELMNRFNSIEYVTLHLANKGYFMEGCELLPDFVTTLQEDFSSNVQRVNFANKKVAGKDINAWVKDKTRDKIKNFLNTDDLNPSTPLVLLNSTYFKGSWKHEFNSEETTTEPFYLSGVDTVDVPMMHLNETFSYKNDEVFGVQILEMECTNEDLSVMIILPNERDGIGKLERMLADANFTNITRFMYRTEVKVTLPKFTVEEVVDLKDTLTKLELGEVFVKEECNFRDMIQLKNNENLHVNSITQKSVIEVNEEGAEAAAIALSSNGLIVSTTEFTNARHSDIPPVNLQMYFLHINTNVNNRFARTLVTSKVRNSKSNTEEMTFSVILPENAFISEFEMEIKGKIYKAYIKEKEEAKQIYQQALTFNLGAAHVEASARDSKTFTVSVNVEPKSEAIFRLIYEELLQRQLGKYELVVNIHPGQLVEDLDVQVYINESRRLTFVRAPSLRSGNEINRTNKQLKSAAKVEIVTSTSATVKFNPDVNQQKKFAKNLGGKWENGFGGQFVVQYDVERDPHGGEILVQDGYFVHFFAPSELEPLPKHVVFVLDYSGSMSGRKIDQLIDAMNNILVELKTKDLLNIIRFSTDVTVWSPNQNRFVALNLEGNADYGHLEPHLKEANLPEAAEASRENIEKAKRVLKDMTNMDATNIIGGLEVGLFLIRRAQEDVSNDHQPMLIFLTDGLPNVGISLPDQIVDTVTKLNSGANRAAIFSLSFGPDADKLFLQKLASRNLGFSRHIYEAADASLQLQDFYSQISSPLLSNVNFKYVDGVSDVTRTYYPLFFGGAELVVAGRTGDNVDILPHVNGKCTKGCVNFNTIRTQPVSSLERLWAYLTVKQLLKDRDSASETEIVKELTRKALDLALKYSFVTSVSSLVVVKPNETDSVNAEKNAAAERDRSHTPQFGAFPSALPGPSLFGSSQQGSNFMCQWSAPARPASGSLSGGPSFKSMKLPASAFSTNLSSGFGRMATGSFGSHESGIGDSSASFSFGLNTQQASLPTQGNLFGASGTSSQSHSFGLPAQQGLPAKQGGLFGGTGGNSQSFSFGFSPSQQGSVFGGTGNNEKPLSHEDDKMEEEESSSSAPPEFRADHPFILLLLEKKTNQIFVGRISVPGSK